MEHFDIMAEQRDAAGASIIPGIAVFKTVNTPQAQLTCGITSQAKQAADYRFVEKLQPFVTTGKEGGAHADFAGFQAVQPEPDSTGRQAKE